MVALSDFEKQTKAETITRNLGLTKDLSNLNATLDALFNDAPPAVRKAVSKSEIAKLVKGIQEGTADNNKIARFLELAEKLNLSG